MLFPTLSFAVFFAIVLPASWLLMPRRARWRLFMVAASWWFYGAADWRFVALLAWSTATNFFLANIIDRQSGRRRSAWTAAAISINLAVLGWFKYIGFLALSSQSILNLLGLPWRTPLPDIALPVGISFFTFQALSYVIDTSRGKVRPNSLLDFAVYLSFFPHLVAGPIVRASEFLPQIRRRIDPRKVDASRAFWLITLGLFKKVVVASYLASRASDPLFGFPNRHGGIEALFGVYAYAIQIYADFSGYTDIAIGLALLLGIQFPQNFNAPYAAASLQEFWRRWHMTLSRWLRDYLYVPLGGSRRSRKRTSINLMITMLLGGLWHGAGWTFVAWGGIHGAGLVTERWLTEHRRRRSPRLPGAADGGNGSAPVEQSAPLVGAAVVSGRRGNSGPPIARGGQVSPVAAADPKSTPARSKPSTLWWGRLLTFHVVCLGWIFFRATSFHNAREVLARIVLSHGHHSPLNPMVVAVVVAALVAQLVPGRWASDLQARFSGLSIWAQSAFVAGALVMIDILGPAGVPPFIYFRF